MSEQPPDTRLELVPYYDEDSGPGWEWLEDAPRLRRLEDAFPLRCCINLAMREDRRNEAGWQFARQGLTLERMPGVDGRKARSLSRYETPGQYGCALTHRLILRRAIQERARAVLIFEDDVVLHPEFRRLAESLPLPEDWGVLFFGCQHLERPVPHCAGVVRVTRAYSLHAYAIRDVWLTRVLHKMRESDERGVRRAVDVLLADLFHEIPAYAVYPNIAWQATTPSDITRRTIRYYQDDGSQAKNRKHLEGTGRAMWSLAARADDLRHQTPGEVAPLIVEITGGTGNHIFQWAFGRVLSEITGRELFLRVGRPLHPGTVLPEVLGVSPPRLEPDWMTDLIEWKWDCPAGTRERVLGLLNGVPCRAVMLRGYWQNPAMWEGYDALLRREIKMPEVRMPPLPGRTPVCVTVRRGDYLKWPLFRVCGLSYYRRAMALVRQRMERPQFLVISDDAAWCREHLMGPDVTIVGSGGLESDYALMLGCQAFIIANSTYAWWPAWLSADKPVICPAPWFNGRVWHIVPDGWEAIPATEPGEQAA